MYVCMNMCMYGDHEEVIRVEAMKMLQVEDEVHPTFLDNRLVQGFEEASEFQVKVFGRSAASELELQSIHLNVCYCVCVSCVCMYVCMYVCMFTCIYIGILMN